MKITIKHKDIGRKNSTQIGREYNISVNLYNRHNCLGIDFDKSKGQIIFNDISIFQAKEMIKQLMDYIYDQRTK